MQHFAIGFLMCLFLQANCELQRTTATKKMYMPFYKLYTPEVILSTAEFTSSYYNYSKTALTFGIGNPSYRRLFKLPLIPGGILTRNADISVKITVGLQNDIRSSDSDPKFLISDGERGIGFEMREESSTHCRGMDGLMGDVGSLSSRGGATYSASILPEEFVVILAPSEYWGSCYSPLASGLISPVTYTQSLYLDQELWLEVYAEDTSERYLFNYIIVEIHEN